jgi:glutamate 5-kinase
MKKAEKKEARARLAAARRIVVKIGSKTLASDPSVYARIASVVAAAREAGREVVIVSSGAIALGVKKLGYRTRPKEMAKLQAAAAAGQSVLMGLYEEAFEAHRIPVAQVLLTHADLADRTRDNNARAALGALLEAGAVPVLNENDSVSVEEIKFGDNDQLASMVVPLIDAEVLVLLSDVAGLLDASGARIPVVVDVARDALPHVHAGTSGVGTGGMASKVEAARRATLAGADVVVADARDPEALGALLRGEDVGTLFVRSPEPLGARRHWIAFTLRPKGTLIVDAGAAQALRERGKSLLAVGVLGVRGLFAPNDAVVIVDAAGQEIARGLARHGAQELARLAGKRTEDDGVAVHRDDLVVWPVADA